MEERKLKFKKQKKENKDSSIIDDYRNLTLEHIEFVEQNYLFLLEN